MSRCRKPRLCLPYAAPSISLSAKGGKSASESIPFACQKDTYRNVKGMLLQRHKNIVRIWLSNRMRLNSARTQTLSTGNRKQQWWKILITILDKKISQQTHHSSHRHIRHCMSTPYGVTSCMPLRADFGVNYTWIIWKTGRKTCCMMSRDELKMRLITP